MAEGKRKFSDAVLGSARACRRFLEWMEIAAERLAPERSRALAEEAAHEHGEPLRDARRALDGVSPPQDLTPFAARFLEGFAHVERCFELFTTFPAAPPSERISRILGSLHELARAEECFYSLRHVLPSFERFWPLPDRVDDSRSSEEGVQTGVVHVSRGGHHGGFSLYVPEYYSPDHEWPVIVALHGGSGNGRDFLWTWLREARRQGYLLITPTAVGPTWGEVDDQGVLEILRWTSRRYRVASDRVLLTGLSDGGTFTLLYGLLHRDVYRALAPLCGVLHPANAALGNLERARGAPVYLVHGALDFLFPVELARLAHETLVEAGAAVLYRELPELSHTYPRSENARILSWFECLPERSLLL